jgi:two-component system sensor histidine kinase PilS (NtrC family)
VGSPLRSSVGPLSEDGRTGDDPALVVPRVTRAPVRTLEQNLKRLMVLRILIVTTLLLSAVYVETTTSVSAGINPLYFVIAGTYGLSLLYVACLGLLPIGESQVFIQVLGDISVITALVYLTGGTGGRLGFMLLYPLSVLSGSALLSRWRGLILAAFASTSYLTVWLAVRQGMLSVPPFADTSLLGTQYLFHSTLVMLVACGTVAFIGSYLSHSLQTAGERLAEATEEVADLRQLNEIIVESIQSGLITSDLSGRILYVNEVGASIIGLRPADMRGRNVSQLAFLRTDLVTETMERGAARLEVGHVRPDGAERLLGVSISRLATQDPQNAGYLFVFQDLTDIKRLEHDLRMKERLAAAGGMAARLAHEIRNPLGSICGSAQMLMSESKLDGELQQLLSIIIRESRRLSDILGEFLTQARPGESRPRPTDLRPLIEAAVTLLRNGMAADAPHHVEFDCEPGPHVCVVDPDRVAQVFWNLARNGLEAMDRGGGLFVTVRSKANGVVLSVRDEGRGISEHEQDALFEPFHSASGGVGLGLAIVYQIVREHGGDISVVSAPGRGTEVQVRFPPAGDTRAPTETTAAPKSGVPVP